MPSFISTVFPSLGARSSSKPGNDPVRSIFAMASKGTSQQFLKAIEDELGAQIFNRPDSFRAAKTALNRLERRYPRSSKVHHCMLYLDYLQGRYQSSTDRYQRRMDIDPLPETQMLRASAHALQRHHSEAQHNLDIIKNYPRAYSEDIAILNMTLALARKDLNQADRDYQIVLSKIHQLNSGQLERAIHALLDSERYELALKFCDQLESLSPQDPVAIIGRACVATKNEHYGEAIAQFKDMIGHHRYVGLAANFHFALALFRDGQPTHALDIIHQSIDHDKLAEPEFYDLRAHIYFSQGQNGPALNDLNTIIDYFGRGWVSSYVLRAQVHYRMKHYDQALKDLLLLADHQVLNLKEEFFLLECFQKIGDFNSLKIHINSLRSRYPDLSLSQEKICLGYFQELGDHRRILDSTASLIHHQPNEPQWPLARAVAYLKLGRLQEAYQEFSHVEAKYGFASVEDIGVFYAATCRQLGQLTQDSNMVKQALRVPHDPELYRTLGLLGTMKSSLTDDQRLSYLNQSIKIKPLIKTLVQRSKDREKLGQTVQALGDARQVIRLQQEVQDRISQELVCPITQDLSGDPVVIEDGTTYDRSSIATWMRDGHRTSPTTRSYLQSRAMFPNLIARNIGRILRESSA